MICISFPDVTGTPQPFLFVFLVFCIKEGRRMAPSPVSFCFGLIAAVLRLVFCVLGRILGIGRILCIRSISGIGALA